MSDFNTLKDIKEWLSNGAAIKLPGWTSQLTLDCKTNTFTIYDGVIARNIKEFEFEKLIGTYPGAAKSWRKVKPEEQFKTSKMEGKYIKESN